MSDELQATNLPEEVSLINETDPTKLRQLIDIFNLNIRKKDIIRATKLSALQDRVVNEMSERIINHSDNFSNKDLLDYFKTIQDTQNKTDTSIDNVNIPIPTIQINHNEVNMNSESVLSRESKNKVSQTVQKILKELADKSEKENLFDNNQENLDEQQ